MATTPRQQLASPQSFTSDPLEQVFAKGMMDAGPMGAFAGANFLTSQVARERGQEQYLTNLNMTNQLSAQLARQDMQNDLLKELLTQAPNYAKAGIDPAEIPMFRNIYSDIGMSSGADRSPNLHRLLLAAQAAEANAKAAHAGDAGADTVTYTQQMGAYGPEGGQIVVKSKNPDRGAQVIGAQTAQRTVQGGLPAPPPGQPYARTGATPGQSAQSFQANKYGQ